jgi:hypothetical protein
MIPHETRGPLMDGRFWLGLAAYVLPTFPIGYAWHLMVFASQYEALHVYRPDVIIPFGLASMLVQGSILTWLYPRVSGGSGASWLRQGLVFGLVVGLFAWSFSTVAVAAKYQMTSVPLFMALETGFTALHYAIVGPLIALAHRR